MRKPVLWILMLASASSVLVAQQQTVDCDRGGNLQRALDRVARSDRHVTLNILGTCTGNFTFAGKGISLRGESAETSALVGNDGSAVLTIRGDGSAVVDSLTVSGGEIGILFERGRFGTVSDCVVRDNSGGIVVSEASDAFIRNTLVESNDFGIETQFRSSASVVDSVVRNNASQGLGAFKYSDLALTNTVVDGNGPIGIKAWIVSSINVIGSSLSNHEEAHVLVRDRSTMNLITGTTLGSRSDATPFAAFVSRHAELRASSAEAIWGDVLTSEGAYVSLASTTLEGACS